MQNPLANTPKIDDSAAADLSAGVELVVEMDAASRPARLEALVETATAYANAASSENTRDAYAKDWRHFTAWCRREGFEPLPPASQVIGLYISACAAGDQKRNTPALSVATIERRLSGLAWNFTQRGTPMDRADRHIATVLAGIRRKHAKPPRQKEAVLGEDIKAMVDTLGQIISGRRSVKELGGPIKIAQVSGQQASLGMLNFVMLMALISINLGFINLLPIPMLDGGHLAFYLFEGIARRPVPERAMEWAFRSGLAVLLSFMIFVTLNDILSLGAFKKLAGLIG